MTSTVTSPGAVVGVDVGGTFTDILVVERDGGRPRIAKVPSQRTREADGFLAGLRSAGIEASEALAIVHGTTVGTNALLERSGGPCGVITTRGFRDVLELRRRDRPTTWGLRGTFEPVVPRDLRVEVGERTLADGTVLEPVEADEVRAAARTLLERGARAVAVVFVNSYADPTNERVALDAVREVWPDEHVCASSDILRELREFERSSTTALNGYLQPVVGPYLERLEGELGGAGFAGQFLVVQSNGGVMTAAAARRYPVRTTLSGPAAGVIASAAIGRAVGHPDVITCDMGGTSFDVALIHGGAGVLAQQASIDFGLVVRSPMIEITTIGAGGGSIARVDAGGILRVGPESAGSIPGPACYGMGNDRPTLTDANVVLGRIDAERPIGGQLETLDVEAARAALRTHVGGPLGLDVVDAAAAVLRVSLAQMAGAVRLVTVERGHDPARFALMPFGGAGGLMMGALLREVGAATAIIPRYPGLTSALGCIIADLRRDAVQTVNVALDELRPEELERVTGAMAERLTTELREASVPIESIDVVYELDMCYVGQSHAVTVPLPTDGPLTREVVRARFEERYRAEYGQLLAGLPILCQTVRTAALGRRPALALDVFAPDADASLETAALPPRDVWFGGTFRSCEIWDRLRLPVGSVVTGPSILQQPDTTIVLEPGLRGEVDRFGNVIVTATREQPS